MKKPRQSFQTMFVQVLDKKIPAKDMGRRKRVSRREAVLLKLIELANAGHSGAAKLLFDFSEAVDIGVDDEETRRESGRALDAIKEALKRYQDNER